MSSKPICLLLGGLLITSLFFISPKKVSAQVVINEFSSSTSSDWIELYATEGTDITGWYLDDDGTTSVLKTFETKTLTSAEFFVVEVSNRLNNPGDIITLFDNTGTQIDSVGYGDKGELCLPSDTGSLGRDPDGTGSFVRFSENTKGSSNTGGKDPCPTPTPEETKTPTPTPSPTKKPEATQTPGPLPTGTVKAAATKKPTSTPKPKTKAKNDDKEKEIITLGLNEEVEEEESPSPSPVEVAGGRKFPTGSLLFILGGISFMGVPLYSFIKTRQNKNSEFGEDDENT